MKLLALSYATLLAAALAMPAIAAGSRPFYGEAVLATPIGEPMETTLDGVTWRCEGDKCVGTADYWSSLDSHMKECRKVAAALGTLSSYTSRGRTMTSRNIGSCNRPS
jgi:hypothetical protein